MRVDLPAPFCPSRPMIFPRGISKLMSSSTTRLPKFLDKFWQTTSGVWDFSGEVFEDVRGFVREFLLFFTIYNSFLSEIIDYFMVFEAQIRHILEIFLSFGGSKLFAIFFDKFLVIGDEFSVRALGKN